MGRETAVEYEKRTKKNQAEREAREKVAEEAAVAKANEVDLQSTEGCSVAASLLNSSLCDGVIERGLSVARIFIGKLFSHDAGDTADERTVAEREEGAMSQLTEAMNKFLREGSSDEEKLIRARVVMWMGAVHLNAFVSSNWTGPELKVHFSPFPSHASVEPGTDISKSLQKASVQAMEEDSEIFYAHASLPMYLRAALCLLVRCKPPAGSEPPTLCWWGARAITSQQRLLQGRSATLHGELFALWDQTRETIQAYIPAPSDSLDAPAPQAYDRDRHARMHIEIALAHTAYWNDIAADEALEAAREASGLQYEITGKIGIRRKFQTNHLAQLMCLANSRKDRAPPSSAAAAAAAAAAANGDKNAVDERGELDEDGYKKRKEGGVTVVSANVECDILERVKLDEDQDIDDQLPLSNVDQAYLLGRCGWIRRNRAKDEMNREMQAAICGRVVMHSTNWIVFTTSLLSRCRVEITKPQTVDKACLQMQVLVDQFNDEEPSAAQRIAMVYTVPFPPRWGLRKELAEAMMKVGMLRTAAGLYKELGLYKEMVECYIAMDEEELAEKLVREQLEERKTPYMLSIMGFLKKDAAWYEEAWELSGHRFAQARRWHAQMLFEQQRWSECIPLFKEALAISTMYPDSWFKLGCAAMRDEQWDTAVQAFLRVVKLEPESFECWGNIGAVHMGQQNYSGALHAFEEAIKLRRDSWKMWQNLRAAALQTERWGLVLNATLELLNLQEKDIDVPIVALLVEEALKDSNPDSQETTKTHFQQGVERLLQAITTRVSDDPRFWQVYARYLHEHKDYRMELECRRKVLRSCQTAGWHSDPDKFRQVAGALAELTEAYLREGSPKSLFSAKSALSTALAKSKDSFEQHDKYVALKELLETVQAKAA